jgi:putative flippase GtrA
MLRQLISRYRQFFVFALIGVVNTGVHGVILMLCVEVWSLAIVLSHFISFSLANVISFILNSLYTFNTKILFGRYLKFWMASMVSLGLTLFLSWLINEFGFHYMIGFMLIVILVPIASFLLMKFWAFSNKLIPDENNNEPNLR